MKKVFFVLMSSIFVLMLGGCASGANKDAMTISPLDVDSRKNPEYQSAIAVREVTGGEDTNAAWTSEIDAEAFKGALIQSLQACKMYSQPPSAVKYQLSAQLINVDQPMVGFDMTVATTVRYTLTDMQGKVVMSEEVKMPHTATVGDAFMGVERLKKANEGSARKNITEFIKRLNAKSIQVSSVTVQ